MPGARRLQERERQLASDFSEAQCRGVSHRQSLECESARLKAELSSSE